MFKKFLSLTACLLLTACSQLQTKQAASGSQQRSLFSFFRTTETAKPVLSPWHYESLELCHLEHPDALESFKLPRRVDIWDRIRDGFALPEEDHKRVGSQVAWLSERPHYLNQVSARAAKYMYHIVEELHERNLPMELALLPIVESSFDPFAYSHGRAAGMWQVVPNTADYLGLKQNWWYDGRRDVIASTDAALNYLEQLNRRFDGDWLLTLAAYNGGQGTVARAIRKNKKKGLPTDYWSLSLPKETEMYVPKLLAIKTLVNTPDQYGLALTSIPNLPFFEPVDIGSQINLSQAAALAGLELDEFYALNPGFNRWATDPEGPHILLVPTDRSNDFRAKIAALPSEERLIWDRYIIQRGDTLASIARRYQTTVETLQSTNNLRGHNIRAGKPLLVPKLATGEQPHKLMKLAVLPTAPTTTHGQAQQLEYTVKRGDSLWSIARSFKVTPAQLAKWNKLGKKQAIFPGQTLTVHQDAPKVAGSGQTVKKLAYKVRKGDSLAGIASKFNLRVADIVSWNSVNPRKYLQPGDLLTLFVDVTTAQR